jgi:hypothetical protein
MSFGDASMALGKIDVLFASTVLLLAKGISVNTNVATMEVQMWRMVLLAS